MTKKGYSRIGFFGETIHYDANGNKIGETRRNFWGSYDHFDVNGNKIGTSRREFFGGMDHFDNDGNKTGHSHRGFFGEINHHNAQGDKVGESIRNFWGGTDHHGSSHPMPTNNDSPTIQQENSSWGYINSPLDIHTSLYANLDEIQDEIDTFIFENDAVACLEDNGFDPDDFDL